MKLNYKLTIKKAFIDYENRFNDDIMQHFLTKNSPEFWKSWSKKMHRNVQKEVFVNDSNDGATVANAFAQSFESSYCTSSSNAAAKAEFEAHLSNANNVVQHDVHNITPSLITVELVDKCMRKLKLGKAGGPDGLSAEHLINAHPALIINMCLLFRGIATHGYVPKDFGSGIIVPLLKDKLGDVNDLSNYRGITLIPVISKLLELVILEMCEPCLQSDDLQFGFKPGLGCANAIFVLNETVQYFNSKDSKLPWISKKRSIE